MRNVAARSKVCFRGKPEVGRGANSANQSKMTIQPDTLLPGQTQNLSITATTSVNSITAMIRVTQM
jgi:hypothetical protein